MARFTGILGILSVLAAAWLFSTDRRRIRWRTVAWGIGLQFCFAFLVLRFSFGQIAMRHAGDAITQMLSATFAGTQVLFGELGLPNSGAFGRIISPNSGAIFAFQVLPTIIFISAFFAVLYHIGLMQQIIRLFAWIMLKTMRISGAESMNVAASIFMGQTEAPLTIRPFLNRATRSELMCIMTSGMAHVSGGIMAMYIAQGIEARHLLEAVVMTSPGTILIAKMLVPETEIPDTEGKVIIPKDELHKDENLIGAIARGTIDGGKLALNVAIMLISFLALVALLDMILAWVHLRHSMDPAIPRPDPRLRLLARSLGHRHPRPRLRRHRQPLRHPHGPQRGHRLHCPRRAQGRAGPAFLHHSHLCPLRLRQLRLHRHADRRHRRISPRKKKRLSQVRSKSHVSRHHG